MCNENSIQNVDFELHLLCSYKIYVLHFGPTNACWIGIHAVPENWIILNRHKVYMYMLQFTSFSFQRFYVTKKRKLFWRFSTKITIENRNWITKIYFNSFIPILALTVTWTYVLGLLGAKNGYNYNITVSITQHLQFLLINVSLHFFCSRS